MLAAPATRQRATGFHLVAKDAIAQEVAATFKLAEAQAVKIVRSITGRARFFRRAFDLMAAK